MSYRTGFFLFALALTAGAYFGLSWPIWVGWLISINVATFSIYRLDKWKAPRAKSGKDRIPENDLHLFALIGGSPGAYLGMILPPRHKVSDHAFQVRFRIILAIQIVAIAAFIAVLMLIVVD